MKKKLLILINSDLYVRNYIKTNSFRELIKKYDCYFLGSKNDILDKNSFKTNIKKKKFLGYINYSKDEIFSFQKYLYNNFLINKNKSKTISYLIKVRNSLKLYQNNEKLLRFLIMFFLRFFSYLKKNVNYIYLKVFKINIFNFSNSSKLKKILENLNPDLIIFPMQDSHLLSYDVLKHSKKKCLALIDNWDNLSSRGSYDLKPDFITVWGNQTKKHAIIYQKYNPKNIFVIGTPRFERYFLLRNKKIEKKFNFRYFLFLESFGSHNNAEILEKFDNLVKKNILYKDFKIIYRPHPWQVKHLQKINVNKYSNVIIDPQLESNYYKDYNLTKFQPNIKYYPSLLKNAEAVITGPTSMVIESTIFYKKTLLLGYKSNLNISYFNELENFVHLEKLEHLNNIIVCKNLDKFEYDFNKLIQIKINKYKTDSARNYYLFNSKIDYPNKLKKIVEKILNDKNS